MLLDCRVCRIDYAVTKLKIKGIGIPHMVSGKEMWITYCVPLIPNFYSVTACRIESFLMSECSKMELNGLFYNFFVFFVFFVVRSEVSIYRQKNHCPCSLILPRINLYLSIMIMNYLLDNR